MRFPFLIAVKSRGQRSPGELSERRTFVRECIVQQSRILGRICWRRFSCTSENRFSHVLSAREKEETHRPLVPRAGTISRNS